MAETPLHAPRAAQPDRGLPARARLFLMLALVSAAGVTFPFLHRLPDTDEWLTFAVIATGAAFFQFFPVYAPRDQNYGTAVLLVVAGALLLPLELLALLALAQHIPEWLKLRYRWYLQTFNIANWTLAAFAGAGVARLVGQVGVIADARFGIAAVGVAAVVTIIAVNHAVLAVMLRLARGHTLRETGLFTVENLTTELTIASLGVAFVAFWHTNPWLIPFALTPLVLVHRSLHVPLLQEAARVDSKTGLFNARHFAAVLTEELARAERFGRPASLIMADLDLLRDINNTYGHLAGDAVLADVAEAFREQLRHYDVPARFGGEEFAILLPETSYADALAIAERIRRAVAAREVVCSAASEPIRATLSMGVATFPAHGKDATALVHHADVAVYRAKLQGRNRVLGAGAGGDFAAAERPARLVALPADEPPPAPARPPRRPSRVAEDRRSRRPAVRGPRMFTLAGRVAAVVVPVAVLGIAGGAAGIAFGRSTDVAGILAVTGVLALVQVLALELDDGSFSVGAVGAIGAAALFDTRAALLIAAVCGVIEWSVHRAPLHRLLFVVGTFSLSALVAAAVFRGAEAAGFSDAQLVGAAVVAGLGYYATNTGLLSLAVAAEGKDNWPSVWQERFRWLLPHYLIYGLVAGLLVVGYRAAGLIALALAIVPLLLSRSAQAFAAARSDRGARELREAAETIHTQNVSLEAANRLLRERSTRAMETLSETIDARDAHTVGHSRRVERIALAIGRELGLSQLELDLLGRAALFHDIGKLSIPDSVLLKAKQLDGDEWGLMRRHSDDGARMIDHLGFLADAVPAIRHHHERFDGAGYPDGLSGEEIPLGARIIHVADALDSMLTARSYRPARPTAEALDELRRGAGSQFCPRCVRALEQAEDIVGPQPPSVELVAS